MTPHDAHRRYGCGACSHADIPLSYWRPPQPGQADPTAYRGGWCRLVSTTYTAGAYGEALRRPEGDPHRAAVEREDRCLAWQHGRAPSCVEFRAAPHRLERLRRIWPLGALAGRGGP